MTLIDIRPGIFNLLLSNAQIVARVVDRVYPVVLPQGMTLDSIVYNRVVENESYHYVGPSGLVVTRVQIDAWSMTPDGASELGDLIKEHLGGFSGQVSYSSNSPSEYVRIQGIFLLSGDEDYEQESGLYRRRRDYSFIYADRNA
jgi:hypothetical protein